MGLGAFKRFEPDVQGRSPFLENAVHFFCPLSLRVCGGCRAVDVSNTNIMPQTNRACTLLSEEKGPYH
jgi:hypothetical protein